MMPAKHMPEANAATSYYLFASYSDVCYNLSNKGVFLYERISKPIKSI